MPRLLKLRSTPALACLAVALLLAPAAAQDEQAFESFAPGVSAAVVQRITEIENDPARSKKLKKCLKFLTRARKVLVDARGTRTENMKTLRKVVGFLRRWEETEEGRGLGLSDSLDDFQVEIQADTAGSRALGAELLAAGALKKFDKLLDDSEKKLLQAAQAAAQDNLKKQAGKLLQASRKYDKARALLPDGPQVPRFDPIDFVYVARDAADVQQVYVAPVVPGAAAAPQPVQVTQGEAGVSGLQTGFVDGRPIGTFLRSGDLFSFDLNDRTGAPTNLSTDVPELSTAVYSVSSAGGFAVARTTLSQLQYFLDLDAAGSHDLEIGVELPTFLDEGVRFIHQSIENSPFLGTRLDLVVPDAVGGVTTLPIAGPSVTGTSASAPVISQGGRALAYLATAPGARTSDLYVTRVDVPEPGAGTRIAEAVAALTGLDFRRIAAAWGGEDAAGAEIIHQEDGGSVVVSELEFAQADVQMRASEPLTAADVQRLAEVLLRAGRHVVGTDSENRLVHVDTASREATVFGAARNDRPDVVGLGPSSSLVVYEEERPGEPDELRVYDLETSLDQLLVIPDPDPDNAAANRIQDLQVHDIGGDGPLLTFAVESTESGVAGVFALLRALSAPLGIQPDGAVRLIDAPPGGRLGGYRRVGEPTAEHLSIGALYRVSVVLPGDLIFGGAIPQDGEWVPVPSSAAVDAEGLARPFHTTD